MNYEKKYKEALSRATFYNNELLTENQRKMLLDIFPELKNEDEITRKSLIRFLKSPFVHENITDEKVTPWIAWLEKQGKKLDADKVIEWIRVKAPKWLYDMVYPIRLDVDAEDLIKQFIKDFGL